MSSGNAQRTQEFWTEQLPATPFRTLIVGDLARWGASGHDTAAFKSFEFCSFNDLNTDILRDFAPEMILSPLVGDNFDVLEVASCLRRLGYKGYYRAISPPMPNACVIVGDVRTVAPKLDFDVVEVPTTKS